MKHLHPFPARMAPELALAALQGVAPGSVVLDPMSGSGTVLRQAAFAGHHAIGYDLDPLAVLISQVSSRPVDVEAVEVLFEDIIEEVKDLRIDDAALPWIDGSNETREFVAYWFGTKQRNALRKLAFVLWQNWLAASPSVRAELDVLKVALSRIIITKENGASLARDVSHSRPHKVRENSDYDVLAGFERSARQVLEFLEVGMPSVAARSALGDARTLADVENTSIDLVVTSPPYLNAIDYLRGHKLSLVWLGYGVEEIRRIRSGSIGAERAPDLDLPSEVSKIESAMLNGATIPNRVQQMIRRYAGDLCAMLGELRRVMKATARAVMVVGDSCLQSVFISNSEGIKAAAALYGFRLEDQKTRDLPVCSRYLPVTGATLSKRMRLENILRFRTM